MPQQIKVTRTIRYPRTVTITGNYNVPAIDSGNLLRVSSDALIALFLPEVASNAGLLYNVIQGNTGAINLVGATNTIYSVLSVNATHYMKSITGINVGIVFSALCDGTRWNVWATQTPLNVGAFKEA